MQTTWVTPGRRLALFLAFSLSCLVPVILLYVWHDPRYALNYEFGPYWIPVAANSIGAFFYIKRIPEKWSSSGRFDFLGASH